MNINNLINLMPDNVQKNILSKAQLISIELSQIIHVADQSLEYLYFPQDGFISIVQTIDSYPPLEVGMIGREGMLGVELMLGIETALFGAIVQGSGNTWKIKASDFLAIIKDSAELEAVMKAYLAVRMSQIGLSAACEHFHEIAPRLAKWLLMSQDRAQSTVFLMTHEFIALMLGVRRVGVTTSAAEFRRRGLIEYSRGTIEILNRAGLESEACSCYQKNRKIYSSLISSDHLHQK